MTSFDLPKLRTFMNTKTGCAHQTTSLEDPPADHIEVNPGGQMISRAEYPELFRIIGEHYGAATDTEFKLPDFYGRVIGSHEHSN